MPNPKMLILRGNSAKKPTYPNEKGDNVAYPDGALHEKAAKDYATCRGYDGDVLDVSGDPLKDGDRDKNPQTVQAVLKLRGDSSYAGIYGFSGGGYDVLHILKQLKPDELKRIKLVVVLGAPPVKNGYPSKSDFESARFVSRTNPETDGIKWELVYMTNPPADASVLPKRGVDPHMFGPEWLLAQELKCRQASP
ncbi:hypothetical protein Msil_0247 [Methylocella silvestris BL2]|uniref:Alpha/beta hydrolase n=1 Tax=Methylocella silvestris (strain DSM 15510 / CIP 108128 / LMG 27833 / NCIMB 13906 / BL2) TaxID=395965 RepID=B8ENY9_METSB|nr:hypothetical protein [Methylocella silvestris]ACK49227.1 hypothetical protein Msil_0247 [Methylocella silvestris BL2]